jgi:hypothetical protein
MRALLLAALLAACSNGNAPAQPGENAPSCDDRSVLTSEGCVVIGATDCASCAVALPACAAGTFAVPGAPVCHAPTTIPLNGTVVHVDATAADGGDGSDGRPYRTVQAAVNAAPVEARISIAAGTYRENVRIARPLTLIGVDAGKVELAGIDPNRATLELRAVTTIAGVSVSGRGIGIAITDTSATISNVRVHDTAIVGINVDVTTGTAAARIEHSLIESAAYAGVASFGAEVEIVGSAIRDTRFLDNKGGPGALGAFFKGKRPKLTVRGSLIERTREVGVGVAGGDLIVEDTVVRDIEAMSDGGAGTGILASRDKATMTTPTLLVARSRVANAREMGIAINSGTGTIEQSIVEETQLRARDNRYGVGIQADPTAALTIRNVLVRKSRYMGIAFFGAEGTIENTIVQDSVLEGENKSAAGIAIVEGEGRRSNVTLTRALADRNVLAGVVVGAVDVTLIDCSVRNTGPRADGTFGDGLVALSKDPENAANLTIDGLTALNNARAGVTLFGGSAVMRRSRLACNTFDLNVETYPAPVTLKDDGGNACGCAERVPCRAASNSLLVQVAPIR